MSIALDSFLSFLATAGSSLLSIWRSVSVSLGGHSYSLFSFLLVFLVARTLISNFFDGGDD